MLLLYILFPKNEIDFYTSGSPLAALAMVYKAQAQVVQIKAGHSFGPVSIGAYKAATMLKVPDKLLNDSVFDLEAYISKGLMHRYCEVGTQADMDRF